MTALMRSRKPSLVRMLDTWVLTVSGLTNISAAISALLRPRARCSRVSCSRSVNTPVDALPGEWGSVEVHSRDRDRGVLLEPVHPGFDVDVGVVADRVDQRPSGYRVCRGQRVQVLALGCVAAVCGGVQFVESRPWRRVVHRGPDGNRGVQDV